MIRIRRVAILLAGAALAVLVFDAAAHAAEAPCDQTPRSKCFGVESLEAALSTTQAGAHPDLTFTFEVKKDPESEPNGFGLKNSFDRTRNVRVELPPGLIGNPNVLGTPQQCTVRELVNWQVKGEGCPNGSQVGRTNIFAYGLESTFLEPIFMMQPPGGDVVARLGFIAGLYPTFIDLRVRSQSDYGLTADITDASTEATLIRAETTTWGVPSAHSHDTERCTAQEAFTGLQVCESRPPGSRPLPFLTNPTRCGVQLEMRVAASSWAEPERFDTKAASFPQITGCDRLPFGPSLTAQPTSRRAGAPTGLEVGIRLPASEGVNVLEPSQMREIEVTLPEGLVFNPGAGDGLTACDDQDIRLGQNVAAACPDTSKLADAEFDIPALSRRLKGAVYLRQPRPGDPFRIWVVADDLGLHLKLPGDLHVDPVSGQVDSIFLDPEAAADGIQTEGIPQAPVREAKLLFKSGFRAPLLNPPSCGEYLTNYEFTPWSGGSPVSGSAPMTIDEGCQGLGGFSPTLRAGTLDSAAGKHSPFVFRLIREDGEQNPIGLDITLPTGLAATFAGIPRCLGAAAQTGACPPGSRIGKVIAAVGSGPAPLWVPQAGKRPTAVYLSGPYKGAPLSIVAVVPRQAGPFDFGDEVVRSAIYVDPTTAQATAKADPLPQVIEGIPIRYRTLNVELDRPDFMLNPTSCAPKQTSALVTSTQGAQARPSYPFEATDCVRLPFKPHLSFHLSGPTRRAGHPALRAVLKGRPGDANIAGASVALPHSEFLDNGSINTVCTRVQFAHQECPAGSIYGFATAKSPLFDEQLSGPVYLRSSSNPLPDLVVALKGPATLPIEVDLSSRVDSIHGGIRNTFEVVPDAPVTEFSLSIQGGKKKGLLENSKNLCTSVNRATAKFSAQNGRSITLHPALQIACKGKAAHKKSSKHRRAH
jgi:hypothetical protein